MTMLYPILIMAMDLIYLNFEEKVPVMHFAGRLLASKLMLLWTGILIEEV